MKTYKVTPAYFEDGETYDDVLDLINVDDFDDRIMAAPDNFKVGEIVTEDQIKLKECNMVDDHCYGKGWFAFKKGEK